MYKPVQSPKIYQLSLSQPNSHMQTLKEYVNEIKGMKLRRLIQQCLNLGLIVVSAFMIWKSLIILTHCESPVVVVLSGSMEPAYYRGDILFLTFYESDPVAPGDVVVYNLKGQEIPIVHRVTITQEMENGEYYILTKGDNNKLDDRALYNPGQKWLHKSDLMGKIRGYVPYVGMVTILLNDYPVLKGILLGLMSAFVLIAKDPQN